MANSEEVWCDICGYEGVYQISNLGRVYSLKREVNQGKHGNKRSVGGYILKTNDNGHGYLTVGLASCNTKKLCYVHRLVAEHFIPNGNGYNCVNHKDYDTHNNRVDNLEWCTQKQNIDYSAHKMRKPHKQWKQPTTGEKYIYLRDGRYRLSIRNVIDKTYPTLEAAVNAREVVLSGKEHFAG